MALLSKNFKIWFRGLLTAAITAFSTALTGAISLPTVFNFTHNGWMNILKLSTVPTVIAVGTYLMKSPLPAPDSAVLESREISPDGTEKSTSIAITTSPDNGQVK